eukprot:3973483-Amphidinium_carterae.1
MKHAFTLRLPSPAQCVAGPSTVSSTTFLKSMLIGPPEEGDFREKGSPLRPGATSRGGGWSRRGLSTMRCTPPSLRCFTSAHVMDHLHIPHSVRAAMTSCKTVHSWVCSLRSTLQKLLSKGP